MPFRFHLSQQTAAGGVGEPDEEETIDVSAPMPWRLALLGRRPLERVDGFVIPASEKPAHQVSLQKFHIGPHGIARFAATLQPDEVSDRDSAWADRPGATSPDYVLASACAAKSWSTPEVQPQLSGIVDLR